MAALDKDCDLWEDGVVPYEIDPDHGATATIHAVIAYMERRTNLRFVRRIDQNNYLRFTRQTAGDTHTDDYGRGSPRDIADSYEDMGLLFHEVGHAMGLVHEQQRSDRDQYVRVLWENIPDDDETEDQFEIRPTLHSEQYDYYSMMHYHLGSAASPLMEVLDPTVDQSRVGRSTEPSTLDIDFLNTIYPHGPGPVRRSSGAPVKRAVREVSMVSRPWPDAPGISQVFMGLIRDTGTLAIVRWRIGPDGSVRYGSDTGDAHGVASSLQLAWVGDHLVGVMRNGGGQLYLIAWDGDMHVQADSGDLAGEATCTRIMALTGRRLITACINGSGRLFLITWRISTSGSFTRLHDSGNDGPEAESVDLCLVRTLDDRYVLATAIRTPGGRAQVITWNVPTADWTISRVDDTATRIGQASMIQCVCTNDQLVLCCANAHSELALIPLRMNPDGSELARGASDTEGHAGKIKTLNVLARPYGSLTTVRDKSGKLRLLKWRVTDGRVRRLGSSGDQAGDILNAVSWVTSNAVNAPVVTAATTHSGQPLLITWDDVDGPGELQR